MAGNGQKSPAPAARNARLFALFPRVFDLYPCLFDPNPRRFGLKSPQDRRKPIHAAFEPEKRVGKPNPFPYCPPPIRHRWGIAKW